jgi:hypothetical protein
MNFAIALLFLAMMQTGRAQHCPPGWYEDNGWCSVQQAEPIPPADLMGREGRPNTGCWKSQDGGKTGVPCSPYQGTLSWCDHDGCTHIDYGLTKDKCLAERGIWKSLLSACVTYRTGHHLCNPAGTICTDGLVEDEAPPVSVGNLTPSGGTERCGTCSAPPVADGAETVKPRTQTSAQPWVWTGSPPPTLYRKDGETTLWLQEGTLPTPVPGFDIFALDKDGHTMASVNNGAVCPISEGIEAFIACESKDNPKYEPSDVPAIQKKRIKRHKGDQFTCGVFEMCTATEDEYEDYWTCQDGNRVLEQSVNGLVHTCRKVQP